jgi:lipopolysaccharide/colanic/teichoic acid biosynthesis glycosyltransferase
MQEMSVDSRISAPTLVGSPRRSLYYKRPFDLVLGVLLLVLMSPVALIVAIVVKLSSPGPILFSQERIGRDGRPFTLYKFRTMRHGADAAIHREYFAKYLEGQTAPGEGSKFKMRRDPRITRFGGFLRRVALDEIPQIINVIKGDMSLVGPRPPLGYEVELYGARDRLRLAVKPGMTGLWQIKGRDVVDFATMIDQDLEYIKRQSLWLDFAIVVATVPALAWAYITK